MVSVNILWLVLVGLTLVVGAVVVALRWSGRTTRGQHAFYAEEVSVEALADRAGRRRTVRVDELLARARRGQR